jgi:membrane protease YdiL (CAAX protease family)
LVYDGGNKALMNIQEDYKTDKKRIKFLSNVFTLPLLFQQVYGAVAFIIAAVIVMLIRTALLGQVSGFSLNTFLAFISQSNNSDVLNNIFYDLCYLSYMFIPFVIIATFLKQNPLNIIPMKIHHADLIFPAIVFGLFLSVVGGFYSGYFQSVLQLVGLQVQLEQFSSFPNNTPALILYFIQLSILAPICEEFVFRGLILQSLRKYGNFFAVLVSSVMFGILHGNFSQTPFAFVVGLALALTVIETGSIWISIIIHCLINSTSLIFDGISYYCTGDLSNRLYNVYMVVVFVLTVAIVIMLRKKRYFRNAISRYSTSTLPVPTAVGMFVKTPGCMFFIIIYVLIMISSLSRIS